MRKFLRSSGLFIFFFIALILLELVLRLSTMGILFPQDFVYPVLFSIPISLLFYLVSALFNRRDKFFIPFAITIFISLLFASQMIYYKFFKTFYTLYSASKGGQILEFWRDILVILKKVWPWMVLILIPIPMFSLLKKRVFILHRPRPLKSIFLLILFILSDFLIFGTIYLAPAGPNSPYEQVFLKGSPTMSIEKLGLPTAMALDGLKLLWGDSPFPVFSNIVETHKIDKPIESIAPSKGKSNAEGLSQGNKNGGTKTPNSAPKPPKNPSKHKPIKSSSGKPNILGIDFDSLITSENNEEIRDMHQYFKDIDPTHKNQYTGKYRGYNLIFITAESFSPYAVQKDVTPTLYKMVHEGYNFSNFYNPIWEVSTLDGEYVACTGLLPKHGVWSFYKSGSIHLPFVMGNQLKELGYKTMAYHNHTYDYYRRDISHPNMGYEYKGVGKGLSLSKSWPRSDLEMMEKTLPEYIDRVPFHTYYMTVSGHMQYNFFGNHMAVKNREVVKDLPYTEAGKAYIATQVEFDRAMEFLLKGLEDAGIADKTLIAISADHYPYGLEDSELEDLAGHSLDKNFEIYKSTFILYTKGMEPVTISKPCSSLDIIPTLSNLLGLDYDSRLLMGRDIFSDSEGLVIFLNRSFITDKGQYDSVKQEFIPSHGNEVDENYIGYILEAIEKKFHYSTKILDNDYYESIPSLRPKR